MCHPYISVSDHARGTSHAGLNQHPFRSPARGVSAPSQSRITLDPRALSSHNSSPMCGLSSHSCELYVPFLSLLRTEKPNFCPSTKALESQRGQTKANFLRKDVLGSVRENTKTNNQPKQKPKPTKGRRACQVGTIRDAIGHWSR